MGKGISIMFETNYTEEQADDVCQACRRHGICPPYKDRYIMDTVYDVLRKLTETMDRVKALEEAERRRKCLNGMD